MHASSEPSEPSESSETSETTPGGPAAHQPTTSQPIESPLTDVESLSGTARQWVSLIVAIHCICVGLAFAGNYLPSPLLFRLRMVLSPYLTTLHLDPAPAHFYSTRGREEDQPYDLQLLRDSGDSRQTWQSLHSFPTGTPARLRQLRAARMLGILVAEEAEEDIARFVRDVAHWSQTQGLEATAVRLQRRVIPSPSEAMEMTTLEDYFETVYSADVIVKEGAVAVVKRTDDAEAARVIGATP